MVKNFDNFLSDPRNESIHQDQFRQQDRIKPFQQFTVSLTNHLITIAGTSFFSCITAPLTTAQIALQLSVVTMKNKYTPLYQQIPNNLSETAKQRSQLIIDQQQYFSQKPFRSPIYQNYSEAFSGLGNQGFRGFYKGNFLGIMHTHLNGILKLSLFQNQQYQQNQMASFGINVTVSTLCDIIMHPLQTCQSRFILQDRNYNFRIYNSFLHYLKKAIKNPKYEMFNGALLHLPRNLILCYGWDQYFRDRPIEGFIISNYISVTLTYPMMTVLRRLQCQTSEFTMLQTNYNGIIDSFKSIYSNEGFKGFYRGYLACFLVNAFMMTFLAQLNNNKDQ